MKASPRSRTMDKKNEELGKMSRNGSFDERSPESRQRSKIDEWRKKIHVLKAEIEHEQKQKDDNVSQFLEMSQKAEPDQISILKNIFEKRNFTHGVKIQKAQAQVEKYLRKIEEAESVVGRSSFYSASSSFDNPAVKPDHEAENQKRPKTSRSNENILNSSNNFGGGGGGDNGGGSGGGGGGSNSSSLQRGLRLEDYGDSSSPRAPKDHSPSQTMNYNEKNGANINNNYVTPNNNNSGSNSNNIKHFFNGNNTNTSVSSAASNASFELAVAVSLMMREVAETRQLQDKQLQDLQQQQDKVRKELEDLRQFYAAEMKNANYRYQRLEDQLNDQVDIHHTELANLKQEIGVLAAKEEMDIVEFRSKERSRDLHEQLEACQQKVEKMEKTQENFMTHPENLQGIVLPKIINFVLGLIQIGILIVNTASSILSSRWRLFFTSIIVLILVLYRMQSQERTI